MSKSIQFDVGEDTEDIKILTTAFTEKAAKLLAIVGVIGAKVLYDQFLSGQELTFKGRRDKRGVFKATGDIMGRPLRGVQFKSYPLNLFERGRILRSGRREPGKKILTGKFRGVAQAQLQSWVERAKKDAFPEL